MAEVRASMGGGTVASPPFPPSFAPWSATWRATLALIAGVLVMRLAYLAWLCPFTLIEDEAHYWEWSRRLAMSYYTKGPGIAWAIAAGTRLLGDTEVGVRLLAPVSSAIGALCVATLTRETIADRRAAFFAALCWLLAPMFQVLGLLMTIDGPYAACWALGAWGAWRAIGRERAWGWLVLGAALGVGTLFKYTTLLMIPGVIAAAWLVRPRWRTREFAGLLGGVVLFALGVLPIILWNQREGWPTVRHLLGHLGVSGGDTRATQGEGGWRYSPLWTLSFLGTQIAMMGPLLILAVMEIWGPCRRRARAAGERVLIAIAAPVLVFYLAVSFVAAPEGNWALAGYVTLFPLAARRVVGGMEDWNAKLRAWRELPAPRPRAGFFVRRPETPTQVLWYAAVVIGLATLLGAPALPLLARVPGLRLPLHRFTGADTMARHVEHLEFELAKRTRQAPFVVALHYGRASQMAFYLPGRPTVYCASSLMLGGRATQYDFWEDTDLRRDLGLLGRPAVALGGELGEWQRVFERVELVGTLRGDGKKGRPAFLCEGFRGFPPGGLPPRPESN
ncbi:hypothetical protein PHYC_03334 [Phycisphaerales bacterium]|nr:hypothetical protein PHYC_03334 [Phycisphaerales bacterium]